VIFGLYASSFARLRFQKGSIQSINHLARCLYCLLQAADVSIRGRCTRNGVFDVLRVYIMRRDNLVMRHLSSFTRQIWCRFGSMRKNKAMKRCLLRLLQNKGCSADVEINSSPVSIPIYLTSLPLPPMAIWTLNSKPPSWKVKYGHLSCYFNRRSVLPKQPLTVCLRLGRSSWMVVGGPRHNNNKRDSVPQ